MQSKSNKQKNNQQDWPAKCKGPFLKCRQQRQKHSSSVNNLSRYLPQWALPDGIPKSAIIIGRTLPPLI